jgi:hypothetical protein
VCDAKLIKNFPAKLQDSFFSHVCDAKWIKKNSGKITG